MLHLPANSVYRLHNSGPRGTGCGTPAAQAALLRFHRRAVFAEGPTARSSYHKTGSAIISNPVPTGWFLHQNTCSSTGQDHFDTRPSASC